MGKESHISDSSKMSMPDRRTFLRLVGISASATALSATTVGVGNAQTDASAINDQLSLLVSSDGGFTLATTDGSDLLFPASNTSALTIRVDGTNYTTNPTGTSLSSYLTQEPTTEGETVSMTWTLPENLVVTQRIALESSLAVFTIDVMNQGNQARNVSIRYLFDYQVRNQDGAPIRVEDQVLTTETQFNNPGFDSWRAFDQIPTPTLVGLAEERTKPDTLIFAHWPTAVQSAYEYDMFDSDRQFYTPGFTTSPESDSAGLLYWELGDIDASDSTNIATAYGTGDPADINPREALNFAFDDQESDSSSVIVQSIFLSSGGFVAIHRVNEDGSPGEIIGASEYLEPEVDNQDVEVTLDQPLSEGQTLIGMPHLDTNENQTFDFVTSDGEADGPYTDADGNPITDPAVITVSDDDDGAPALVFDDQVSNGKQVTVGPVTMPQGGFIAVTDADGALLGVSEFLENGEYESVMVLLDTPIAERSRLIAVAQADTNSNREFDPDTIVEICKLDVQGDPLMDDAEITVES